MSKIDKGMQISKHITLEIRLVITIHILYILFIKFHYCYQITHKHITWLKKFDQWMGYLQ
jgi:hypothetical protein